jgi:CBS domain-containing protein
MHYIQTSQISLRATEPVGMQNVSVASIMTRDVKTVTDNESLQQSCIVMSANKIGSVIVVSGNGGAHVTVGIITERDVINHIAMDASRVHSKVGELMSRPLVTVSPNTSLRDALRIIVSKNIRRLPVIEGGVVVGIVTDKDIYRAIVKDEALLAGLISDEMLIEHVGRLEQPWVYKLGEILHKRMGSNSSSRDGDVGPQKNA